MKIKSKRIYLYDRCISGVIEIEDGKIICISEDYDLEADIDFGENRIIPGIFDTHNHGTLGYSMMGPIEDNKKEIYGYLKGLASQGVTGIFPSTSDIELYEDLARIADEEVDGAKILGIHSEGPYCNRVGEKGVDTGHPDIDLNHIQDMIDKANGKLKLMALAPELPMGKEAVEYLVSKGVKVAICHTNALYEEALESFKWGISVSTHTANVMTGIHHRNMGTLGACLLDDEVYNEVICDGKHVANNMLEIMFRIKNDPYNKFMMVSDCSALSGAKEGTYLLAEGFPPCNITKDGYCLTDTGRLMGSTMPVLKGIKNLVENVGVSMKHAIRMASLNPSKFYGYPNKGVIEVGKDADIIIIDDDYNCLYTISEGRCVYDREVDKDIFNKDFLKMHKA